MNLGYGLIGAFAFVYIGSAVLKAWYEHLTARIGAMVRGGTITLIYRKLLLLPANDVKDSSAIALMGNDVETLSEKLHFLLVESWANTVTVAISIWMLSDQLGAVCVAPVVLALANGVESMTQALTFEAYAIAAKVSGNQSFSAAQAIAALSILNVLIDPLQELLMSVPQAFSAIGCFKRVEDFLSLDERTDRRLLQSSHTASTPDSIDPDGINLKNFARAPNKRTPMAIEAGSFYWDHKKVLSDINLSVPSAASGSLTIITGPVGCGKSTLLKGILGETSHRTGNVILSSPNVAFCDQTPWITNATLRDNIIGESRFQDEGRWFNAVVDACDLRTDFSRLPDGEITVVGDSGVKLSGGQKQRIAIARAVYARKPVAIFDDVFSGLDKITERTVFDRVFSQRGILRRTGTQILLATHAVHVLPEADEIIVLGTDGRILEHGHFSKLQKSSQHIASMRMATEDDENMEETVDGQEAVRDPVGEFESRKRAVQEQAPSSDRNTFKYYFATIGPLSMAVAVFLTGSTGFSSTFRAVWVTWWGNGRGHEPNDLAYWLTIYTCLAVLEATLITLAICHFVLYIGPTSGRVLHSRVLKAVMEAPMNFLSIIETGSLVNRFSQDMRFIDIALPVSLVIFLFQSASSVGTLGLAVAAVPWIAISVPFIAATLVIVQRFYVRTSKQLRLLDIEQKAPLYSHFLETMSGLSTIRAFGWASQYAGKTALLLDSAQKPSYLLSCIQRWLTLVLDLVVAVLIVMLVTLAVLLRSKGTIDPSLLGIALVNMMYLGINLKNIVLQWSTLETSLGAVSRVKAFSETTPSEHSPLEIDEALNGWPARGSVQVQDLTIQYDELAGPILRDVSFSVSHGTKLGLCGRSGSGKSSLIQAILRMVDISDGRIVLDGKDITNVPRNAIRRSVNCLTQEPFLFTETIRFNADPLGVHTDDEIVEVLSRVGLWTVILGSANGAAAPLNEKMTASFLSHGQKQLFCLARALLSRSSVLILDEPTSSVDSQTDAKIQEIVRSAFKNCTIIMIAHRLESLLDFDWVLVLDKGRLVEQGNPIALLADKETKFAALYRADKTRKRT
ncbi:sulfonylurea receptor/ ABC transporter [Purpureocillium lilacinum]|uniref:Sulfonylurea receptor/ ABC transporter n=1 Tax=Purpureocillium lilacinum TaxID=33203 RepID=A0A179FW28_PURLI|nr:sulfonylurea receptor/ ABC transporter [Purpureocillium lilacinum]